MSGCRRRRESVVWSGQGRRGEVNGVSGGVCGVLLSTADESPARYFCK